MRKYGLAGSMIVLLLAGLLGQAAAAPAPGFDFDPVKLEWRMDSCISYQASESEILMGWMSFRDGRRRDWRCSSLRHMMFDLDHRDNFQRHDPYVNIPDFIRCVDELVSYGFPRPGDPGNTKLMKNYNGTSDQAIVVVNNVTGDIVTVYTTRGNDWSGCANAL
ncbi:hypothetical protein WEH80_05525 [Actinomycetes bacterium KLBMP 9759]